MVYRYNGKLLDPSSPLKECSRCKLTKSVNDFSRNRRTFDGRYAICKDCKYEHNQNTKHARNLRQKEYNDANSVSLELKRLERRKKRLDLVHSLKDVPCMDCGGKFPPYCMDFDHRDQSNKSRDISQINRLDQIVEEAKKCDVVCSNCHRIRTHRQQIVKFGDREEKLRALRPDTELIHDHKQENLASLLDPRV